MFQVKVYTPQGIYKEVEATMINVVTDDGQRGIMENHMPIVAPLLISKFEIIKDDDRSIFAIGQGMLFFKDKVAKIIVESIEGIDDIDIDRAYKARDRALERLKNNSSNLDIKRAQAALNKALNRINIFG